MKPSTKKPTVKFSRGVFPDDTYGGLYKVAADWDDGAHIPQIVESYFERGEKEEHATQS